MYSDQIKNEIKEDQQRLAACKTKEDMNALFKGRKMMVNDGSDWQNEVCDFVEMVGDGPRSNWKMRVRTPFGTSLDLAGNKVLILTHRIATTDEEANVIKKDLEKKGFKSK